MKVSKEEKKKKKKQLLLGTMALIGGNYLHTQELRMAQLISLSTAFIPSGAKL